VIGPDDAIVINSPTNFELKRDSSGYKTMRYILGVLEGSKELKGENPLEMDMLENNAICLDKIKNYPELTKQIENDVKENLLVSFILLSKSDIESNFKSTNTNIISKAFQNLDTNFNEDVIEERVKGDDEVSVGRVIAQECNMGVALIDVEKYNSKPFTFMSIKGYEAYLWKSQRRTVIS